MTSSSHPFYDKIDERQGLTVEDFDPNESVQTVEDKKIELEPDEKQTPLRKVNDFFSQFKLEIE